MKAQHESNQINKSVNHKKPALPKIPLQLHRVYTSTELYSLGYTPQTLTLTVETGRLVYFPPDKYCINAHHQPSSPSKPAISNYKSIPLTPDCHYTIAELSKIGFTIYEIQHAIRAGYLIHDGHDRLHCSEGRPCTEKRSYKDIPLVPYWIYTFDDLIELGFKPEEIRDASDEEYLTYFSLSKFRWEPNFFGLEEK